MKRNLSVLIATIIFSGAALVSVAARQSAQQTPPQATSSTQAGQQQRSAPPLEFMESDVAAKDWPKQAVVGAHAMVVSDNPLADAAGVEILKKGGNAVDAAAAVAFALAVVEPRAGNIGGGGFMLVRLANGKTQFVDYREEAPKKASREMYRKADGSYDSEASRIGYLAVGVPGTVAGMDLALKTYGKLTLADVIAPAIRLADGFTVSEKLAISLRDSQKRMGQFDRSKHIFLNDGKLFQAGETIHQPELAATLRRIASKGAAEFYTGQTAREFTGDMAAHGGIVTMEDLAAYKPKIREPLRASYDSNGAKWEVITSPPPSSGGIAMIEALNILAPEKLKGWNDATSVHWVAEAMRLVFADRATFLGDSDFVHVPTKGLTDPRYAAERRAQIDPVKAGTSQTEGAGNPAPYDGNRANTGTNPEALAGLQMLTRADAAALSERDAQRSGHTTHFSVVDAAGNAVANTYTLNDSYGAAVTAPGGFLLNDEMDDFTAQPGQPNMFGLMQSEGNTISPGKRPLSSMMPTIVLRDGKLSFVTGSPGGPTIISVTMLSVLNWMHFGPQNAQGAMAAINTPRFHHQWMPDTLVVEQTFPKAVAEQLTAQGYKVEITRARWLGEVNAIGIDAKTGERLGAPDPRRQGAAQGY
jgi:gamma-glutamyltranspeptidase / glutathione hydrolase